MEVGPIILLVWAVCALIYFGWAWIMERERQNRERNRELAEALRVSSRYEGLGFSAQREWTKHL